MRTELSPLASGIMYFHRKMILGFKLHFYYFIIYLLKCFLLIPRQVVSLTGRDLNARFMVSLPHVLALDRPHAVRDENLLVMFGGL